MTTRPLTFMMSRPLISMCVTLLTFTVTLYIAQAIEIPPRRTAPPTIVPDRMRGGKDKVYFDTEGEKGQELVCRALGSQPITFEWIKNGNPLDIRDPMYMSNQTQTSKIVSVDESTGTILITELKDTDEGTYQCVATNKYGTSMSRIIHLKKSTKNSFDTYNVKRYKPFLAHSLKIPCNPPENDPPGRVKWIQNMDDGDEQRNVDLNERISIDDEGNLHFANVQQVDENEGQQYICILEIAEQGMLMMGSFSVIEIQADYASCSVGQFMCTDGYCLESGLRCDGTADCPDSSDEVNCTCGGQDMFQCNNGVCINNTYVCNGQADCTDRSDEPLDCNYASCSVGQFMCTDGYCLESGLRCDGTADCPDSSDEVNCTCGGQDMFQCNNGVCINNTYVCNGQADCTDRSDEPLDCNMDECSMFLPCSHGCEDLPIGYKCHCLPGFQLRDDKNTCEDIDECKNHKFPCSHFCINTVGSFNCKCAEHYKLSADHRHCELLNEAGRPYLLVSNRYYIRKVNLDNGTDEILVENLTHSVAIDFDIQEQMLYWTDIHSQSSTINRKPINNKTAETQVLHKSTVLNPDGIAVDWVGRNLYWCDRNTDTIEVSQLDGKFRKILVKDKTFLKEPRALEIFPKIGYMFLTDWGDSPHISKISMDGKEKSHIITETIAWPNALTIDYVTEKIFWADANYDYIAMADLDGSNRVVILTEHLPHTFALTTFMDDIYWTDWETNGVFKADKFTWEKRTKLRTMLHRPMDLVVYHSMRQQPLKRNPCDGLGCTHLCLLHPLPNKDSDGMRVGASCACPENHNLMNDSKTCHDDCNGAQYLCKNEAKCIWNWWVCDGHPDCDDASDESNCTKNQYKCSQPGLFQCHNASSANDCIPPINICDGKPDCTDGSDETQNNNCDDFPCMLHQMKCVSNSTGKSICISDSKICDGVKDCQNGEDEAKNCTTGTCQDNEFQCPNTHKCIPYIWQCDGDDDCGQYGDENASVCNTNRTCKANYIKCEKTLKCIPQAWECDGERDCGAGDNTDELADKCGNHMAAIPTELVYSSKDKVTALKGEIASFRCIFSGNPTPTITWQRINGVMDEYRMKKWNQRLKIPKIKYEDAGTYECRGTNPHTSQAKSKSFKLEVESKPEWTSEPRKVDAGDGESATFECAAEGRPMVTIQWYINGKPLESLKTDSRRILSNGQLRFVNLNINDAQVIQCNASNLHGYIWADVALSIMAFKPEISAKFTLIKIAEDQSVMLPCETAGKPNPSIYWKRGGQKIEGPRYQLNPTGNLTIPKTTLLDTGEWACYTENKYGKENSTGKLVVRKSTKIMRGPKRKMLSHGKTVQFTCQATTDAEELENLVISWRKDGDLVDMSDPRISLTNGFGLMINGTLAKDTGNYTCVASNGLDSDTQSATLDVLAPPDAPFDVGFVNCATRSVKVIWTAESDNFNPITEFRVEYNHSYTPFYWKLAAIVKDPSKRLMRVNISPFANYTFRVIAVNDLGASEPSKHSKTICRSRQDKPDKHPTNVHTDRSKPGVLIIKWDSMQPIEHNGEGFHYILSIKKDGKKNSTTISDWRENTKEFDFGQIYEPYQIWVEAANDVDMYDGPADIHIGYSGEAEPLTAPSNFELVPDTNVTSDTAEFQWDPVDTTPEMIRGEFRGYKVRFWKKGLRNTTQRIVEVPRSPEQDNRVKRNQITKEYVKVPNLPPYSDLEADIVAHNTYFDSNSSNSVNFTTLEGVPGPVKSVHVIIRGYDHFDIEWEKPLEPNGVLTGYKMGYEEVNGFVLGELQQAGRYDEPDRITARLDGLKENMAYRVYVWAMTRVGQGEEFFIDTKTTVSGMLMKPKAEVVLVGEDFVNVTWIYPTDTNLAGGKTHFIKYRKLGESDWIDTADVQLQRWINVSGLASNTQYELAVVAKSNYTQKMSTLQLFVTEGEGAPSLTETSITQASWFIGMMVAIAVLMLFFIVVCFIKRSRGEKNNVQEREKTGVTDPEAPEKDMSQEYLKSCETDPLATGSDWFDNEDNKLPGGSEMDSMAEYGDVDPSKFNEDGSFIGPYGTQQKPEDKGNQPSAMTTFV